QDRLERFNLHRNVGDFSSENTGKDFSDFELGEFLRTVEGINLSCVLGWVAKNPGDDPALIFGRDGRIARLAKGKWKNIFLPDGPRLVHEPFGKEGGPQM